MKRKEFITTWSKFRRRIFDRDCAKGELRISEKVMALAELPKEAANLWRRKRVKWGLADMTPEQLEADLKSLEELTNEADKAQSTGA